MSPFVDRIITAALVLVAAVMVVIFIRRESRSAAPQEQSMRAPSLVSDWEAVLESGIRVGSSEATITIVEFVDFECPYCRRADSTLTAIQKRFAPEIAAVYVHFPLPNHRFALPAARVAECALEQQRFDNMRTLLYAKQDSFGLKSWSSYATEAGIPDIRRFNACIAQTAEISRVKQGRQAGERIGVRGTPTVLINGWRFPQPPTYMELEAPIVNLLAGRSPWDSTKVTTK